MANLYALIEQAADKATGKDDKESPMLGNKVTTQDLYSLVNEAAQAVAPPPGEQQQPDPFIERMSGNEQLDISPEVRQMVPQGQLDIEPIDELKEQQTQADLMKLRVKPMPKWEKSDIDKAQLLMVQSPDLFSTEQKNAILNKAYQNWQSEAKSKGKRGFLEAWNKRGFIPFDAYETSQLVQAAHLTAKALADNATRDELIALNQYFREQEEDQIRGMTLGGHVANIISNMPGFAAEFGLTGGLYSAGKKLGRKGAMKLTSKGLRKMIGKKLAGAGIRTAGALAGTAARTAAVPTRIASSAARRLLPQEMGYEDGKVAVTEGPQDSYLKAIMKGGADAYIENLSEVSGTAMSKALRPAGKAAARVLTKLPIKSKVMQRLASLGSNELVDTFQKGLVKIGYNGPLEEMGEERFGDLLRAVLGLQGWEEIVPEVDQLIAEGIAFTLPAAGARAVGTGVKAAGKKLSQDRRNNLLLTDMGAASITELYPDRVQQYASKEQPSRKDAEELLGISGMSKGKRAELSEKLRTAIQQRQQRIALEEDATFAQRETELGQEDQMWNERQEDQLWDERQQQVQEEEEMFQDRKLDLVGQEILKAIEAVEQPEVQPKKKGKKQSDLLGRPVLEGGAAGKQRERVNAEEDIEGQGRLDVPKKEKKKKPRPKINTKAAGEVNKAIEENEAYKMAAEKTDRVAGTLNLNANEPYYIEPQDYGDLKNYIDGIPYLEKVFKKGEKGDPKNLDIDEWATANFVRETDNLDSIDGNRTQGFESYSPVDILGEVALAAWQKREGGKGRINERVFEDAVRSGHPEAVHLKWFLKKRDLVREGVPQEDIDKAEEYYYNELFGEYEDADRETETGDIRPGQEPDPGTEKEGTGEVQVPDTVRGEHTGVSGEDSGRGGQGRGPAVEADAEESESDEPVSPTGGIRSQTGEVNEELIEKFGLDFLDEEDDEIPDDDIPFFVTPKSRPKVGDSVPPSRPSRSRNPYAGKLDAVQKKGIKLALLSVLQNKNFLNADGTGVGKTRQQLVIAEETQKRKKKPALIITQNKQIIKDAFEEDAKELGIDIKGDNIQIGTYGDLVSGKIGDGSYSVVIFDEAHNLKNPDTKKTMASKQIDAEAEVFATATPMDRPFAAEYFLSSITGLEPETVRKRLGYHIKEQTTMSGKVIPIPELDPDMSWPKVHQNLLLMRDEAIKNGQMVRREYPFRGTIVERIVGLGAEAFNEQADIEKYWDKRISQAKSRRAKMRLGGQKSGELSRWTESRKIVKLWPSIAEDIKAGKKVIVVAERINDSDIKSIKQVAKGPIKWIEQRLNESGIDFAKIYGTGDKAQAVRDFQDDKVQVAVMTSKSGGTGVNLDDTAGDKPRKMYVLTPSYSGDVFEQVLGRVSRRNTASDTDVVIAFSRGASDIRRRQLVGQKVQALKAIQRGEDHDVAYGLYPTDEADVDEDTNRTKMVDYTDEDMTGGKSGNFAYMYGGKGGDVAAVEDNRANPVIFGLKEMVRLARKILGDYPTVQKTIGSNKSVAGRLKSNNRFAKILLQAGTAKGPVVRVVNTKETGERLDQVIEEVVGHIAKYWDVDTDQILWDQDRKRGLTQLTFYVKDADFAAKVLAHEIGHATSWLPDKMVKGRGNILGQIAALKMYQKHMIGNLPETVSEIISSGDKKRLMKEARKLVKALYPDPMKKGQRDKLVKEAYDGLLKKEVENRGIFTRDMVMEELKDLTMWWNPFNPEEEGEDYTKYRYQPAELYAEAVSVLLNNPAALKKRAPKFYEAFFNYFSQRPDAKKVYEKISDQIYSGVSDEYLRADIRGGFRRGTQEHIKNLKKKSFRKDEIWKNIKSLLYSKFAENYKLSYQAKKEGEEVKPDWDPINRIGDARYTSAMVEGYMNEQQTDVFDLLEDNNIPMMAFEEYLLAKRVISEKENPVHSTQGATAKDFENILKELKKKYGPKFDVFEKARKNMWEIRKTHILDKVADSQIFDAETMEKLYNEEYYVRFDVVDYIKKRTGIGSGAKLYKRIGSFKEVAGTYESTLLQDASMLYSINWNSAKKSVAALNIQLDKAMAPNKRFNGSYMEYEEPKDPDLRLLTYMHKGKLEGVYVDKWQASGFQNIDPFFYKSLAKLAGTITGGQKAIYTALNPAFWATNLVRDTGRLAINMPDVNPVTASIELIKAIPAAFQSEYMSDPPEVIEMLKAGALVSQFNYAGVKEDESLIEQLLTASTGRTITKKGTKEQNVPMRALKKLWKGYAHLGQVSERASKIAAWRLLKKKRPNASVRELAQQVRTEFGSPDFAEKGWLTPLVGMQKLFFNPAVQASVTDIRIATTKGRAGSYWMKVAMYRVMPKMMQWAVEAGIVVALLKAMGFGDDDEVVKVFKEAEDIINSQSDYIKQNYLVVPIGRDKNGEGIALSIPFDHASQAISGVVYNALQRKPEGIQKTLVDTMNYTVEQFPGGINPLLEVRDWWWDYARGRNPYDTYRGQDLLPRTEFEARSVDDQNRALKLLAKESAAKLGAHGFIKFNTGDPEKIKTSLDKTLGLPVAGPIMGRFIRKSDYGTQKEIVESAKPVRAERAYEILNIRDAVGKVIKGEELNPDEQQLLKDNRQYAKMWKELKETRIHGDAIANALASARSKAERFAMYERIREKFGWEFDLDEYAEYDIIRAGQKLLQKYSGSKQNRRELVEEKEQAEELLKLLKVSKSEAIRKYRRDKIKKR